MCLIYIFQIFDKMAWWNSALFDAKFQNYPCRITQIPGKSFNFSAALLPELPPPPFFSLARIKSMLLIAWLSLGQVINCLRASAQPASALRVFRWVLKCSFFLLVDDCFGVQAIVLFRDVTEGNSKQLINWKMSKILKGTNN